MRIDISFFGQHWIQMSLGILVCGRINSIVVLNMHKAARTFS